MQVSYGDTLTPQNLKWAEPMCAWRRSEQQSKKMGRDVLMPVMPDATRNAGAVSRLTWVTRTTGQPPSGGSMNCVWKGSSTRASP